MGRFIVRRVGFLLFVWWAITLIAFFLTHAVPADPVLVMVGDSAPPDVVEEVREAWGLDQPVWVQYVRYVQGLVRGDLGTSLRTRRPVAEDLAQYLPATAELALASMALALVAGLALGTFSALRRNAPVDHVIRFVSVGGASVPVFWLGLVLLAVFYYRLGWTAGPGQLDAYLLPPPRVTGFFLLDTLLAGDLAAFRNALSHLLLPALTLSYPQVASIARMTRANLLEVLPQEYVRTARAKGVPARRVVLRHALRNALLPVLTVIGVTFASLLSGAVLTETVFAWPGIGRYATNSVVSVDVPAVVGVTLVSAVAYSLVNLAVDLLYGVLDPRIRYA